MPSIAASRSTRVIAMQKMAARGANAPDGAGVELAAAAATLGGAVAAPNPLHAALVRT